MKMLQPVKICFSTLLSSPLQGLKLIAQRFPEGMTTGSIPTSCLSSPPSSRGKRSSVQQQSTQMAEKRWRFTSDELAKIQEQLDEMLIPSNTNSKILDQPEYFIFRVCNYLTIL